MADTVCLMSNTLNYPSGGGMFWVYANWALGLKSIGCNVIWLEAADTRQPLDVTEAWYRLLRDRLGRLNLTDIALCSWDGSKLGRLPEQCISIEEASERSSLLLNLAYCLPDSICRQFNRSALLDIDPGQLQVWMSKRQIRVAPHHVYFTIAEGVGRSPAIPTLGIEWHQTRPCVSLDHWPLQPVSSPATFTAVSHWYADESFEHNGEWVENDKRTAYEPYLGLPRQFPGRMELAICLAEGDEWERGRLERFGWCVRDAGRVAGTPWDYQSYVQGSGAEFGCAKASCRLQQNAWISDRTVCYLASGKPAVVQYTGPSSYLPKREGVLRFCDVDDAAECLQLVCDDYPNQSRKARQLAEEYFDARKVVRGVLERALN